MTDEYKNKIKRWEETCTETAPPYRFDFGRLHEDIQFLLQYEHGQDATIKRSGMYFERLFGAMVQGRSLRSLFHGNNLQKLDRALVELFHKPAMIKIDMRLQNHDLEMALMPVRAPYGPVEQAIGMIDLDGLPEYSSPTVEFLNVHIIEFEKIQLKRAAGFAENRTGFQHKTGLRVISGGNAERSHRKDPQLTVLQNMKREP